MYYRRKKKKKKEKPLPLFEAAGIKVQRKPDLTKKLDKVFSLYIRLRDCMPNGYFRCPTCGRVLPFEQADCSHYFSRVNMSTRFSEDNCLAECRYDNRFNAEHLHYLRKAVIARIGEQRFELLEWQHNQTKKWSDFELTALIKHYSAKVEDLKIEKGIK